MLMEVGIRAGRGRHTFHGAIVDVTEGGGGKPFGRGPQLGLEAGINPGCIGSLADGDAEKAGCLEDFSTVCPGLDTEKRVPIGAAIWLNGATARDGWLGRWPGSALIATGAAEVVALAGRGFREDRVGGIEVCHFACGERAGVVIRMELPRTPAVRGFDFSGGCPRVDTKDLIMIGLRGHGARVTGSWGLSPVARMRPREWR